MSLCVHHFLALSLHLDFCGPHSRSFPNDPGPFSWTPNPSPGPFVGTHFELFHKNSFSFALVFSVVIVLVFR